MGRRSGLSTAGLGEVAGLVPCVALPLLLSLSEGTVLLEALLLLLLLSLLLGAVEVTIAGGSLVALCSLKVAVLSDVLVLLEDVERDSSLETSVLESS